MKLSEYLKQNGMTSKDYFDMQKRKASGKTTLTDYRRNKESSLKSTIGFDTFESDLKTIGTTVDGIYKGWQSQETMANVRSSVEAMQGRISAFQEYQKMFGGEDAIDLSDLAKGYSSVLNDWDTLSEAYGKHKDADSYNAYQKNVQKSIEEHESEIKTFDEQIANLKAEKEKMDAEYKEKGGYVPSASNSNRPAYGQIDAYQDWRAKSFNYENQIKALEDKKAEQQMFYDDKKALKEQEEQNKKHAEMAKSKEGIEGFEKYLADEEAAKAKKPSAWQETIMRGFATASDTPIGTAVNNVAYDYRNDDSYKKPTDEWTEEQNHIFGAYYLTNPAEAYEYAIGVNNQIAEKKANKQKEGVVASATSNGWAGTGHTAASILAAPTGLVDYIDNLLEYSARGTITKKSSLTPFDYSQAVTEGISTDLNEKGGTLNENIPIVGGKGWGDVYGLGTSIAQSAASAYALGGAGTLVSYFGQGAAAGVDDALSRGATEEQALIYGAILGAAEGATEMMGAEKLVGLGSANEIKKILLKGFGKGGGKEFFKLLNKQGLSEAIEEGVSSFAGQVADNWILQDKSNFNAMVKEYMANGMSKSEATQKAWMESIEGIAYDTLGGYISGVVHAGPQIAVSTFKQNAENKTQGKTIRENERVGDMLDIASMTPQESEAYKAYTEYANRGINAENITDAQLGNLRGITETDALETLAYKDGLFKKGATVEQKRSAVETLHKLNKVDTDNVAAKKAKELTKDLKTGENTEITESGKSASIKGIKIDTNEVITTEGETVSENDVTFSERDKELLGYAKQMDETTANLFLEIDDGKVDVTQYVDSFNLAMAYAEHDFTQDTILENKGVLSNSQVSAIYSATVINTYKAKQAAIDNLNKKWGNAFTIQGEIDDSAIDYDNTGAEGKVAWNSLNTSQRKAITFMKGLARATGMNLRLISNGIEEGINGAYKISENTIILDIYAGMDKVEGTDFSDTIIPTASHEMTHWMKYKAQELYRAVDELVFKTLKKSGLTEEQILAKRRMKMEENHPGHEFSDQEVRDEVIARACEDMLAMSEEGKNLFNSLSATEQKTFVEKIQEIIQNLKDWVSDLLSHYKSNSWEAREMRKYQDSLEELSKLWDNMLEQAVQTNQSLAKEGITGEELSAKVTKKQVTSADEQFSSKKIKKEKYWRTGFTNAEYKELLGIAKYELGKSTGYIDKDNKWLYNNRNGKTYFAIYSTIDVDNPTILYASKGKDAQTDKQWFEIFIAKKELIENGGNDLQGRIINRVLVSLGYALDQSGVHNGINANQRGSNNRNVRVYSGASGIRPSRALQNCLENLEEIQERESGVTQYSDRDTLGNTLTKEQQSYFAESKVRDESGNLKVMYHGTPNATFTKFRSGTYFTEHKWYADNYQNQGASSLGYKKNADNPDTYAVYLNIKKPFDTRNKKERDIFKNEYYRQWGTGTDLMESGLPDWLDGQDLQEFLEEQGYDYDGLILDEGGMGGYGDEVVNRGLSYVVFSPEQVKSVENKTPTNDSDYRFSNRDTLEDLNAQLKEKQNQIYSATMELKKFDHKAEEDKLYAIMRKDGVPKEELDKALQEYSKWSMESGYGAAMERQSALKDEERLLRREIQKIEDKLHEELKEQISHFSEEDIKKYVSKAVRKYRTTSRLENASYLLTTGSMLDFSDGQGYRVKDHREISEILDLPDYAEYSDGMIAFMNMGNIRLQTYGIDISAMPNAKQISALRDIIFKVMREYDEFSVDFSKTDGYSAGSVTYGKGTSASKIVADIKNYFETGVVPEEQSGIRDFLYSDRDDANTFNINDFTIDDLLKMSDEKFQEVYDSLGFDELFEDDESADLYGGEDISIYDISEELNVEPKKIDILVRRKGLGASHIEDNHTAVMTQERIDNSILDSGAGFNPNYARKYITRISTKDFIDLTVTKNHMDRGVFDSEVEGDHGSTMGDYDYESALRNSEASPYLCIDKSTGQITGHNGRHRIRALEMAGIESVEILVEFYDDGSLIKHNAETIPDMAISSQFDTAIETHISNIIPVNETHRAEIERNYGEKAHTNAGVRYSDRDNVSSYETMGELDRLRKENDKFKVEVERLKERLVLERQVTGGTTFNRNQLDAVAAHIRNLANSDYSKKELVKLLDDVYTYIITSKELTWDDLFSKLYDVSKTVLEESRLKKVDENDYFKMVLKEIRNQKISLSDVQKQELESAYGMSWNKAVFGRLKVSDDATMDLDSQWKVWSDDYPGLFDAETTEGDQIIQLLEMYDDLKDGSEIYEDLNNEDMTRWLANEIYNQYWNVSTIKTIADRYDKKIKMLNFEHRKSMNELRDNYEERLAKQKQADKSKFEEVIKKIRKRKEEEIQEVRKLGKERLTRYKEDAARKTRIQSITSNSLTLNEWLIKNSKDKHIHESLKGPVVNLLQAINFSSKQLLGMKGSSNKGTPTRKDISLSKALSKVQKMMADANVGTEELVELYGHDLDASIESMMKSVDAIMETVGDNEFVLNQMTLEDLTTLDNMVKTIKHAVTKMNKFHIIHHAQGISSLAQETIIDVDELGKAKIYNPEKMKGKIQKLLNWKNTVPYYAFKRFGNSGKKVFEAFQDGWDKLAFNVKEIIDFTNDTYKAKEVQDWEKELHTFNLRVPATKEEMATPGFEPQYQEVQMTTAQVMHLYLLNMREAAKLHLLGGGIRVSDIEAKKGEVISQGDGIIFEQDEIDSIVATLTPRQKEVANALSRFMNTTSSDWGNEVSMARFGYRAFTEYNYVPIQADKNNLAVDDETEKGNSLFKLLNMSFTKSLVDNANNRIVISSLFDVFAQHTSDMAKYNALALPVLDAFRWFNYKEKGQKGDVAFITKSVKTSIENAFGKDGQSYITTFLKDINGQENVTRDTIGGGFFKNAKIASVGANIRVALLQPTAYLKASANIDTKYLTKALFHKPKIAKAEKYCGMALWKSMGYFDTNVQRGVAEQIKHAETFPDKMVELSMKGAELGDKLTFGYLWNASELEIREKRKDLKPGSDEFFYEVGKRLRDIIYSTQVVDSTLTRSEMMRSSDGRDKLLTVFASEPTLAYNMLQDTYMEVSLEARRLKKAGEKHSGRKAFAKYGKRMARVYLAYTMTNIVAAMIESGFDVLRDDDDEEMNLAEFMKIYLQNFADNQMILTKIPYVKELVSIMQGFTSTRTDLQWMTSFSNTFKQVVKLFEGDGNPVKLIKNSLQTFSYFSGLPFYNAYRDLMATLDKLEILTTEDLEELLNEFMD